MTLRVEEDWQMSRINGAGPQVVKRGSVTKAANIAMTSIDSAARKTLRQSKRERAAELHTRFQLWR